MIEVKFDELSFLLVYKEKVFLKSHVFEFSLQSLHFSDGTEFHVSICYNLYWLAVIAVDKDSRE